MVATWTGGFARDQSNHSVGGDHDVGGASTRGTSPACDARQGVWVMIRIAVDGKGNLQVHRPHKFPNVAAATLQRPNVRAEKPTSERCRFPESRVFAPTRTFPPRPTSASSGRPTAPGEIPVPRAAPEPAQSFPHALARPEAPVLVAQEVRSTSAMLACVRS